MGETGGQHESANVGGAPEQTTPEPVMDQTGEGGPELTADASQSTSQSDDDASGAKSKVAVVAVGTGAAVAGVAGGIAVASRDTRRRVLGIPIGKRSRFQRSASSVVDAAGTVLENVREPANRVGSRFSRNS